MYDNFSGELLVELGVTPYYQNSNNEQWTAKNVKFNIENLIIYANKVGRIYFSPLLIILENYFYLCQCRISRQANQ